MGLSKNALTIIYWLKKNELLHPGDSVAELGSQQINNDIIEDQPALDGLAKLFGVEAFSRRFGWKVAEKRFLASGMPHLPKNAPLARDLYEHLGLKYTCVDIDGRADSLNLDINFDSVPESHKGKYRLVTNLGTTEHVANQLNALKVVHDFTAKNGIMLHTVPFQGFSAHGFFSYSMQLFWMLCRSNLYSVIDVNLLFLEAYDVPENIYRFAKENSNIFLEKEHIREYKFRDVGIVIVLQKVRDIEFVPPIDIANGSKTSDPLMKKRYWTVFDQESLKAYLRR